MTAWTLEEAKKWHAWSPGVAAAIADMLPQRPVLDLGCGPGSYLAFLAARGFDCLGVDGTPDIQSIAEFGPIVAADLTKPLHLSSTGFGWRPWGPSSILCLEVGEHLAAESESQLWRSIDEWCDHWLILSWAIPGQLGLGHINCRSNVHVYDQACRRGFELLPRETLVLREAADEHTPYFRNTLFAFHRG